MIHHNRGRWHFHTHIATFQRRGEQVQKYISDPDKWQEMVEQHDHLSDLTVEEFEPTEEQQERLDEINELRIPDGWSSVVKEYVETGGLPSDRKLHPRLREMQQEKRVRGIERAVDVGGSGGQRGIAHRIDDLEERIEALEEK